MKISRDEILKLASMSRVALHDDEIEPLAKQLEQVLTYAERITEITADVEEPSTKNVNVFREDVVARQTAEAILAQAPEQESSFFVVPAIIEKS